MRWPVLIVTALFVLALDTALLHVLAIGPVVPSALPALMVFIALSAPRRVVLWCAIWLGLLVDLTSPQVGEEGRVLHLVGPWALGYLFAVNVLLPLRTMVFRRNPFTIAVLTMILVIAAAIVATLLWSIRIWYADAPMPFGGRSAVQELLWTVPRAFACAIVALPIGWLLIRTAPLWGFQSIGQRGARW